jgi:hypothetical protein
MLDGKQHRIGYDLGFRLLLGDQLRTEMVMKRVDNKFPLAEESAIDNWKHTQRNRTKNPDGQRDNYRLRGTVFARVLLKELEDEEKEQERELQISETDWTMRYVKHGFKVSIDHNPFWASVWVCRVLCTYTVSQTLEFYDRLVDDRESKKDETRCARVKRFIVELVAKRFEVTVEQMEEVLKNDSPRLPASHPHVSLIRESFVKLLPLIDLDDDIDAHRLRSVFEIAKFNDIARAIVLAPFEDSIRKLQISDTFRAS